jgi:GrpB-like predicted nucleotidyltransferase (UPF0157 family)
MADGGDTLIGGRERRRIEIVEYDPQWPQVFQEHARRIAQTLGDVALRIEHVGSTSVPGLAAKPIIDILVVVTDSANERSYVPALEAAGYQLRVREPDFHEHRMLRTPAREVHVHVFSEGCHEIDRYVVFRDRLRNYPDDRRLYEQTKRDLAKRQWTDVNDYADAKTEVVEKIIARGRQA